MGWGGDGGGGGGIFQPHWTGQQVKSGRMVPLTTFIDIIITINNYGLDTEISGILLQTSSSQQVEKFDLIKKMYD
jgi:hypothetical protein